MGKLIMFFDVETNGLPKKRNAQVKDVDNWPRVTQLAYGTFTDEGEEVGAFSSLIKPDGWTIPEEKFFIANGMSTFNCETHGIHIKTALKKFINHYELAQILVAHNLDFDNKVLGAEMLRAGMRPSKIIPKQCTMQATVEFCNLPAKWGKPKWPKLEELYKILFNDTFEGAHDALVDIRATAKCYFELVQRGIIKII